MKALWITGLSILVLFLYSSAGVMDDTKKTFNSFTGGLALPISKTSAITIPLTNIRKLQPGWEVGWTFFGKPFTELENGWSGLAFGGKVSYSRWKRDSTLTPITFLGTQGIVRYYLPLSSKPLEIFTQIGGGWFIGEHGFTDPDTVDWSEAKNDPVVVTSQNCFGFDIGVGVNIDVVEILPVVTFVATKNDLSIWLALNLGMTF